MPEKGQNHISSLLLKMTLTIKQPESPFLPTMSQGLFYIQAHFVTIASYEQAASGCAIING
eukprot:c42426_g1_i1 orf=12-194(-)